jgi:DNA-binding response OmpR family regulator
MPERLEVGTSLLLLTPHAESAAAWASELQAHKDHFVVATYQLGSPGVFSQAFDLIIVDTLGPTLLQTDLALCRRLRRQRAHPILLLTPDTDEKRLLRAYRVGIDDCIQKPIATQLLMAKANAWIRFSASSSLARYSTTSLPNHLPNH